MFNWLDRRGAVTVQGVMVVGNVAQAFLPVLPFIQGWIYEFNFNGRAII